jgi:hypothetical protein
VETGYLHSVADIDWLVGDGVWAYTQAAPLIFNDADHQGRRTIQIDPTYLRASAFICGSKFLALVALSVGIEFFRFRDP